MANSYWIEIYEPNSQDTQIMNSVSDVPFPRFEKGDLLRAIGNVDDQNLIVDKIEYIITDVSVFTIKTMVFTKLVPENTPLSMKANVTNYVRDKE